MGDDQGSSPLERRVPGASRAAPSAAEPPVLPDALLQRMQAVVRAAHAQEAEEHKTADEHRREQSLGQGQALPTPLRSLPQRTPSSSNGRRLLPGTVPTIRPSSSAVGWSNADDETSPLPRLTASGAIAASDVDHVVERERAAQQEREGAAEQERQRAAERERKLAAERERLAAELERERAAEQERERDAQEERRRVAAAAQAPADLLEHPPPSASKAAVRRRFRPATLIAAALVVAAGGSLAVVRFSNGSKPTSVASNAMAPAQAAAWVADQVSPTAAVTCDPAMCRELSAKGVDRRVVLGGTASNILHSQLIIATAAVRRELGARLGLVYAPAVIASFGSGDARIDIRVVAPSGPVAFQAALATDLQNRKRAGADLLNSPRVVVSGLARRQMLAGQVTSQLLIDFVPLATAHPIDILAFGDSAPGASTGIPLRSAELSESGGAAAVQKWVSFLRVQKYPFVPSVMKTIRLDGAPVLLIEFPAPTPLGLFATY